MEINASNVYDVLRVYPNVYKRDSSNKPESSEQFSMMSSKIVNAIQKFLEESKISISYSTDEELNVIVAKIKDSAGDVIRQVPPDEMLKIMKALKEGKGGLVSLEA